MTEKYLIKDLLVVSSRGLPTLGVSKQDFRVSEMRFLR